MDYLELGEVDDMDRQATESLARFCIEQRSAFDADDWFLRSETDGMAVALAAKYLSMTSWYGNARDLVEVAAKIHPSLDDGAGLYCEAQASGFDWPYFSTTVRIGIALQQVQQSAAAIAPAGPDHAAIVTTQRDLFDDRPAA